LPGLPGPGLLDVVDHRTGSRASPGEVGSVRFGSRVAGALGSVMLAFNLGPVAV